ncbi:hypothetical protein M2132_002032 [Dysgonomonas sp. PH5-45]|nr:hypothetical protein [Dysgonomonas sp. PH5-45]MDH6388583.1 hypothetical protein [Dysgonomonas sp. PH5-37]
MKFHILAWVFLFHVFFIGVHAHAPINKPFIQYNLGILPTKK